MGLMTERDWDHNYDSIDYAIMCCPDSTIQIYERGIAIGPFAKPYVVEDTFSIGLEEVNSTNVVRYYQNDELLYTSDTKPVFPLKGASSMREQGAIIKNCRIVID